jgi:hypothetical protein
MPTAKKGSLRLPCLQFQFGRGGDHCTPTSRRHRLSLLKRLALKSPGIRQVVALDSNVVLSALAKGRSPSYGLRPCIRKTGATIVAGWLYPAYQFAPTRPNPADHPTRDNEIPYPLNSAWPASPGLEKLLDFAEINPAFLGCALPKAGVMQVMLSSTTLLKSLMRSRISGPYPWILTPPLGFRVRGRVGFQALDFSPMSVLDFAFRFPSLLCGGSVTVEVGFLSGGSAFEVVDFRWICPTGSGCS